MRRALTLDVLALALFFAAPLRAAEPQPQMTGDTRIHDPSVIEIGGRFVAVGTGQQGPTHGAIQVKTSPDGVAWTDAGVIGKGPPAWAQAALGFKPLNVWAPSISRRGEHGLPLLLPVELRPQRERHRAHDQHRLRSAQSPARAGGMRASS